MAGNPPQMAQSVNHTFPHFSGGFRERAKRHNSVNNNVEEIIVGC